MIKIKKLLSIFILLVCLFSVSACQKEEIKVEKTDAVRFKEEYEKLNDTIRKSDNAKYNNVTIPLDNRVKYIDCQKALDIMENETAVIYVGANWCPWCSNAVLVLLDSVKKKNIKTLYYLDLDEEKSTFEIKDKKVVKTKDGSKAYYELLNKLDDILEDYTLTEGTKTYETNEKRIYMPFVMVIKNKKVVDYHVGTVDLDKNQTKYDKLTDKQTKELTDIYDKMLEKII